MGTLVAKKYPAAIMLNLADHTYVECGTGAVGWGCWGGKTGGNQFHQGTGSTIRANAIAEPDERAGITCYLVNGVCHQAANRVLLPAQILVSGARGYGVSEAIYGPYGRPQGFLFFCKAPFYRHDGVVGDLEECVEKEIKEPSESSDSSSGEISYIRRALDLYAEQERLISKHEDDPETLLADAMEFQTKSFGLMMEHRLGTEFRESDRSKVMLELRLETERHLFALEQEFSEDKHVDTYADRVDAEVINFQQNAAKVLDERDYFKLFGLELGDQISLADPGITREAYRDF